MKRFEETQRFPKWILAIMMPGILVGMVIVGALLYSNGVQIEAGGGDVEKQSELWQAFWIMIGVNVMSVVMMYGIKLTTIVLDESIVIKYFPFIRKKTFLRDDILSFKPIIYSPLGDAGGYGVRKSKKFGKVYNANGNKGIFIEMKNGEKFLIGSLREDDFLSAIQTMMNDG